MGSISEAQEFFVDALGFKIRNDLGTAQFYGSGGYHHHVAVNTWQPVRAARRPERAFGLAEYTLVMHEQPEFDKLVQGLHETMLIEAPSNQSATLRDPWGSRLTILVV